MIKTIFNLFFSSSILTLGIELNTPDMFLGLFFFLSIFFMVGRLSYLQFKAEQICLRNYAESLKQNELKVIGKGQKESQIHKDKKRNLAEIFKNEFNCKQVTLESPIFVTDNRNGKALKRYHFISDVLGKDSDGKIIIGEVGTISERKKEILGAMACRNPNVVFVYRPYSTGELDRLGFSRNVYSKFEKNKRQRLFNHVMN